MATDLGKLSEQCATNYEQLKAEAIELNQWASEVNKLSK